MSTGAPTGTDAGTRGQTLASVALVLSVPTIALSLTWTYLSMRAVMDVGGYCAEGGPYVIETHCPDGAWLISVAIPLMLLTTFAGTAAAAFVRAPNLIVPMWAGLFGALGWNFLEYAFRGAGVVPGWLVCGVMFWLMALPAVVVMLAGLWRLAGSEKRDTLWWVPVYGLLVALGIAAGWWTFNALS